MLIFGSFEQSNLRKITSRHNVGLGIGLKIFGGKNNPKSRFKLSLTNAFVKENDNYYRWNSLSSLSYKVGKHIALLTSFENTYENFNVIGIENAQTNATIGLTFSGFK